MIGWILCHQEIVWRSVRLRDSLFVVGRFVNLCSMICFCIIKIVDTMTSKTSFWQICAFKKFPQVQFCNGLAHYGGG